jgi:cytochrome P450
VRSHPVLFVLLAAVRRVQVLRLGQTVLVSGAAPVTAALTRLPLDRAAAGTTGGRARELLPGGAFFDQEGASHRRCRRSVADGLSSAGVQRLRPVWLEVLRQRLAPLDRGGVIDMVEVTAELSGATACALLAVDVDPLLVARAAREAAATAARGEMPGLRRAASARAAVRAAAQLTSLLQVPSAEAGVASMLTLAAVTTTVAGIPRAVAWCADGRLWALAGDDGTRPALVDELIRVVAPAPLLPRVAAAAGRVGGHRVRAGDRLMLVVRHAVGAHRRDPDCRDPAPAQLAQLVFGAGPHACPGARLARAQLADVLAALAPHQPVVLAARVDRRAALPGWASLLLTAGKRP